MSRLRPRGPNETQRPSSAFAGEQAPVVMVVTAAGSTLEAGGIGPRPRGFATLTVAATGPAETQRPRSASEGEQLPGARATETAESMPEVGRTGPMPRGFPATPRVTATGPRDTQRPNAASEGAQDPNSVTVKPAVERAINGRRVVKAGTDAPRVIEATPETPAETQRPSRASEGAHADEVTVIEAGPDSVVVCVV